MKRNNKKGFTIVELVIVIAVIGILAAVLIPTFSGIIADAQENANMQEARNTYTQFMANWDYAEDGDLPAIKYVLHEGKYYDITNSYEVGTPVHGDGIIDGVNSEDFSRLATDACAEGDKVDGNCDVCGNALPTT